MRTRSERPLGYCALWYACALIGIPYFRPRVVGAAHVCRRDGAFIVACSHATLLDWAALAYFVPRPIRFMMTRAYYDRPALRWFCRSGRAIPVAPGSAIDVSAIRDALDALAAGEVVGIFPEGGLNPERRPIPARRGVIELAFLAGVPIVPATIRGAARAFPRGARLPRPRRVTVVFGTPIMIPSDSTRTSRRRFAEQLMRAIRDLEDTGNTSAGPAARYRLADPHGCAAWS